MGDVRHHHRGAKLLKSWRTKARSQQEIADLIGIDLARYNAWEKNRARPGLDWAVKIEAVTDGEVPVKSWAEDPSAKLSRKAG